MVTALTGGLYIVFVLVILLALGYLWVRLMWRFVWNRPVPSYAPKATPEELQACKEYYEYAVEQGRLSAQAEAKAIAAARAAAIEAENNHPVDPVDEKKRLREERRQLWQAEIAEQQRAEEQRRAELAAFIASFPAWLVTLCDRRKLEKNEYTMTRLLAWVRIVLEWASFQPGRRMSVRGLYKEFSNSDKVPFSGLASHNFFVDLLQVLEQHGKLEADPTQTNSRRLVENWE